MSEDAATRRTGPAAKFLTPILVIAAVLVVIVFDPIAALVRRLDLGSIGLPDMPGWIDWIRDLPGPGLLIVIVVLVVLGGRGRRAKDDAGSKGTP